MKKSKVYTIWWKNIGIRKSEFVTKPQFLSIYIMEMEFKEFEPRFKSAKPRFKLSVGINLEAFDTILSGTNHI